MARRSRRNRRRSRGRFAFLYRLLCFVLICAAIVGALVLFFKVDTISVSGNDRYSRETILAASGVSEGDNLFLLNKYDAAARITEALPYVESVRLSLTCGETSIRLQAPRRLQSAGPIRTAPYPGFPTDAQAVLMASLLRSEGATVFVENIFDSRYRHVPEMVRMGADIRLEGRVAVVCGVDRLHGAAVRAKELRGGASLVLAGLQAEGETAVTGVEHIQRGYEDLTGELAQLGADIRQEER